MRGFAQFLVHVRTTDDDEPTIDHGDLKHLVLDNNATRLDGWLVYISLYSRIVQDAPCCNPLVEPRVHVGSICNAPRYERRGADGPTVGME